MDPGSVRLSDNSAIEIQLILPVAIKPLTLNRALLQVIAQATGNPNDSAGAGVEVAVEEASGNVKTKDRSDQPKVRSLPRHKLFMISFQSMSSVLIRAWQSAPLFMRPKTGFHHICLHVTPFAR